MLDLGQAGKNEGWGKPMRSYMSEKRNLSNSCTKAVKVSAREGKPKIGYLVEH